MEGTRLRGVGGLCRIRFTLAPNQSQPGGNPASIAKQCGGVATHGTFQPGKGRAAAIGIRLADLFRGFVCSLARWSGRSEGAP